MTLFCLQALLELLVKRRLICVQDSLKNVSITNVLANLVTWRRGLFVNQVSRHFQFRILSINTLPKLFYNCSLHFSSNYGCINSILIDAERSGNELMLLLLLSHEEWFLSHQ